MGTLLGLHPIVPWEMRSSGFKKKRTPQGTIESWKQAMMFPWVFGKWLAKMNYKIKSLYILSRLVYIIQNKQSGQRNVYGMNNRHTTWPFVIPRGDGTGLGNLYARDMLQQSLLLIAIPFGFLKTNRPILQ